MIKNKIKNWEKEELSMIKQKKIANKPIDVCYKKLNIDYFKKWISRY